MSTEAPFAELSYPSLASDATRDEFERARVRGHAAGYAAGLRRAEADAAALAADELAARTERDALATDEIRSVLAAVDAAATVVANADRLVLEDADAALAAAAIEIAEVIIGHELRDGDASARAAIARVTAVMQNDDVQVVRLNPADYAIVREQADAASGVRFIADPLLQRGDAVLEVANGRIDARISAALDRARAELAGDA
jgi:flagellar assembly protein FliH